MAEGDKLVNLDGLKAVYDKTNGDITDLKSAFVPPFKIEKTIGSQRISQEHIEVLDGLPYEALQFKGQYRLVDGLGHLIDEFTTGKDGNNQFVTANVKLSDMIGGPDYNKCGFLYWDTSKDGVNKIGWHNIVHAFSDNEKTRYPIGYYNPYDYNPYIYGAGLELNRAEERPITTYDIFNDYGLVSYGEVPTKIIIGTRVKKDKYASAGQFLFKATRELVEGAALTPGTNCSKADLGEVLNSILERLDALET